MAIALKDSAPFSPAPNASSFVELYAFERPAPAKPVDQFIEELKDLIRSHPIDGELAEALKYGTVSRPAMQRWIKDYYQFIHIDTQGTAVGVASGPRSRLHLQ